MYSSALHDVIWEILSTPTLIFCLVDQHQATRVTPNVTNNRSAFVLHSGKNCTGQSAECGANAVCLSGRCRCIFGYEWTGQQCQAQNCTLDSECLVQQLYSECTSGICRCRMKYYLDSQTQTCQYAFKGRSIRTISGTIIPVLVAFLFGLIAIAATCRWCSQKRTKREIGNANPTNAPANVQTGSKQDNPTFSAPNSQPVPSTSPANVYPELVMTAD